MSSPSTVLITGGNRGIGKGLVEIFLARPSFIVIVGVRDPSHPTSKALQYLPVGNNSKLIIVKLDSSVPSDAAAAVATLKNEHGIKALDIVIANAGIASDGGLVRDTTVDNIKKHFEVNTIGPIVLFQAVADLLQASKTEKPLFVAISTLLGSMGSMEHLVGLPSTTSPYGGSKAALNWFIRRLHFEEPWLTSFVIHPGLVETEMAAAAFGNGSTEQLSAYGSITIETSVTSLVNVIDKASKELSGTFQNYDGTPIAW
ncbi:short-chain dehydrogenase reductase SDR [Fusarium subglutinans]|uniref:Short-chain dehydrogenase reductase SDR n=1 Tax=Gibberella subglutinans TaxID=42677 RepID=A0A8H5L0G4_GIBSU|nr:short-chain dehydrogenase reductase SDR [Fusarium subglutinans]KAF5584025.1 short-chain dehydrogenase reductase SDR [Fusarium subglutinans]